MRQAFPFVNVPDEHPVLEKSLAFVPEKLGAVKVIDPPLEFVIVTVCPALVAFCMTEPNASDVGLAVTEPVELEAL
jgi:hypothetical protein